MVSLYSRQNKTKEGIFVKVKRYHECPECHRISPYFQTKCDCGYHFSGVSIERQFKACPSCGLLVPASQAVCDCGAVFPPDSGQRRPRKPLIEPVYTDEASAPMRYYKFLARFAYLLSALIGIIRCFSQFTALDPSSVIYPYALADALYSLICVSLCFVVVITLNQMLWTGVVLSYCLHGLQVFFNVSLLIYGSVNGLIYSELLAQLLVSIVTSSAYLIVNFIYFSKRRFLFSPAPNSSAVVSEQESHAPSPEPSRELSVLPSAPKKAKLSMPLLIVSVLLLASVVGNIGQAIMRSNESADTAEEIRVLNNKLQQKNEAITKYRERAEKAESLYSSLSEQHERLENFSIDAAFLYDSIGFIVEGSSYYHHYDCPVYQIADEYWAHNIEYCQYLGYSKCPYCW